MVYFEGIKKYLKQALMKLKVRFTLAITLITALCHPALEAQKPNILLIISDDLNTRIGPYMNIDEYTPHLNRLQEEGVTFNRAYCQYPICGPSRASFMSGLYPQANGVLRNNDQAGSYKKENPALADHPSLAGFFRERGYFTARVSKIFHMGVPGGIERGEAGGDDPTSWDYAYNVLGPETQSQGELELLSPKSRHYGGNFSRMILPDELLHTQTDYLATSQAIAILESRAGQIPPGASNKKKIKPEQPFFLAVGLVRPHVPFIAPEQCYDGFPDESMRLPRVESLQDVPEAALGQQNGKQFGMDELQQKKVISGYMASVQFMDQQVGRLQDALERLGLRENTIVVFMSDHGYNLGEHHCWSKVSLWEGSVRVPLIISVPGPETEPMHGSRSDALIELIDLYPALAELAGFTSGLPQNLQGMSFSPLLKSVFSEWRKPYAYTVTSGGKAGSIRTGRWRYTRWGEEAGPESEELYDHLNDPEEHHNLVHDPEKRGQLLEMRALYEEARKKAASR